MVFNYFKIFIAIELLLFVISIILASPLVYDGEIEYRELLLEVFVYLNLIVIVFMPLLSPVVMLFLIISLLGKYKYPKLRMRAANMRNVFLSFFLLSSFIPVAGLVYGLQLEVHGAMYVVPVFLVIALIALSSNAIGIFFLRKVIA